ncbi:hypothetical protein BV25DRAFT_1826171 [Artomyces pyxidatus]|uniref:Uncharacterized protein n=1 Tax=Artomyces pyxidatus TaxID=48021 RepID=A0ACB8SZJ1_9AGAM|nr:hypothetical protein BV25DRAFT_1826171 [Artomyces pyxidatus]
MSVTRSIRSIRATAVAVFVVSVASQLWLVHCSLAVLHLLPKLPLAHINRQYFRDVTRGSW